MKASQELELEAVEAEIAVVEKEIGEVDVLLDLVFDHSPHGVCVGRIDGSVRFNDVGAGIVGGMQQAAGVDSWADQYGLFLDDGVTHHPPESLPLVRALNGETVRGATVRLKSAAAPQGRWLEVSARPLADGSAMALFRDVSREREAQQTLVVSNRDLTEREAQNRELVERLRLTLDALSTPVLEVGAGVLAVPVIGIVDTQRSVTMTEKILSEVARARAEFVVIDLTGVAVVDTSTADRLLKLGAALRLLGAECVMCGIQPAVAQTLVAIGVDLDTLLPRRDLEHALEYCLASKQRGGSNNDGWGRVTGRR